MEVWQVREKSIIENTPFAITKESLVKDFHKLGLYEGMTVIVHASLSKIGWVCGGLVAVIQALMDVVTPSGAIVMPPHSGDFSDPTYWGNPAVPKEWWSIIKETMPAYEPAITPTRGIGVIAEAFRTFPGVIRSAHPTSSFSAWGKHAELITNNHAIDYPLGDNSPLARIYDLDGWVLLLGAGYGSNTSFHLSEYRVLGAKSFVAGAPLIEKGQRVWKQFKDIELNTDIFPEIGADFEKEAKINSDVIGLAESKIFKQKEAVDYAEKWLIRRKSRTYVV